MFHVPAHKYLGAPAGQVDSQQPPAAPAEPELPEVLRAARDAFAADLARRSHEERERGRRLLYAGMSRSRRRSSY